jgi:hypothetical protein
MSEDGSMLTIQCETASFRGRGTFACRNCFTVTDLNGLSAVLMVLPTTRLVLDAQTGALLHDCAWVKRDKADEPEVYGTTSILKST